MSQSVAPYDIAQPTVVQDRFQIAELVGEGGMATVHAAIDIHTGKRVALKRLRVRRGQSVRRARALFEKEYEALAALSHPRVVQVHHYGIDESGPFYTMELLDGGDVQGEAPIPWRTTCGLMRDVCSVLSLLHSRRVVHRDITPRNIRRTRDGRAKLLDFGAMAHMGPCEHVVGTPTTCAPEVLNHETLDGRADLYSLGCTFYYALTGRHAYPARDLGQLPLLWGSPPRRPSELVSEIPRALDTLVMSLISVEPTGRPGSAAEVMERLSAIADLPQDEQLTVSHAYLSQPNLAGRTSLLKRLRQKLERTFAGDGSAMLFEGQPGLGRTRLLEAALVQACFAGLRTVTADSAQAETGGGVLRALGVRLLQAEPVVARRAAEPHLATLGHLVPALLEGRPKVALAEYAGSAARRAAVQEAYCAWIEGVCRERPVVIAVDDVEAVDELSVSVLALLARMTRDRQLALLLSTGTQRPGAQNGLPRLLIDSSSRFTLSPLHESDTEQLLRSIFGNVNHVRSLAHRLHRLAQGNPRDVLSLARHLLDRGVIRYHSGTWQLPPHFDDADLPVDMADALRQKVADLDADSRELARLWALAPDLVLGVEQLGRCAGLEDQGKLESCVEALGRHCILRAVGERWALARRGWIEPLLEGTDAKQRRALHLRLLDHYDGLQDTLRAARHAFEAGELDAGLDRVLEHARTSQERSDADPDHYEYLMRSLPDGWLRIYERGLALCEERGRPTRDLFTLYSRAAGLALDGMSHTRFVFESIRLLVHAVGLDLWPEVDASLDPAQRIGTCLKLAHARYEATPEAQRLFTPTEALRPLGRAYVQAISVCATRQDVSLWRSLPSLAPLAPLAPAMGIVDLLREGIGARIMARTEEAMTVYRRVLQRLDDEDGGGLDPTYRSYTRTGVAAGLAQIEGQRGTARALEAATIAEETPIYRINALQARGVYALWQGDVQQGRYYREQAELARIQNGGRSFRESGSIMAELSAYAISDDLGSLSDALPDAVRLGETCEAWEPVARFARGEYHRIRGARAAALKELDLAAASVSAGQHQMFCEIVGAQLRSLNNLQRHDEACEIGLAQLRAAEQSGLGYTSHFIRMPLAVALSRTGRTADAQRLVAEVLDELTAHEAGDLLLGLAHETAARVAMHAGLREDLERHLEAVGPLFRRHGNRALVAKLARLLEDVAESGLGVQTSVTADGPPEVLELSTVLSACGAASTRALRALELMVQHSGAAAGALCAVDTQGPTLVAQLGDGIDAGQARDFARMRLMREAMDRPDATCTETGDGGDDGDQETGYGYTIAGDDAHVLRPLIIAHVAEETFQVTGIALFRVATGAEFRPPTELAAQLSRYWLDVGDVIALGTQTDWALVAEG